MMEIWIFAPLYEWEEEINRNGCKTNLESKIAFTK